MGIIPVLLYINKDDPDITDQWEWFRRYYRLMGMIPRLIWMTLPIIGII